MKNKSKLILVILLINSFNQETLANKNIFKDKDFVTRSKNFNSNDIEKKEILQNKLNQFIKLLANNLEDNLKNSNFESNNLEDNLKNSNFESNYLEIISDTQKNEGNSFFAEGNVLAKNNNMILKANTLIYNYKLKKILVKGNILFKADDQFLKASEFEYDFISKKGYINEVYGTINFETLSAVKENKDISNISEVILDKFNTIKNVSLNSSSSLAFDNLKLNEEENSSKTITSQEVKLDINEMQKWRFKTKRLNIENDNWFSRELFLTNDPFNKPQLLIDNRNFNTTVGEKELLVKSKWSWLILDDFIKIPIGSRRIKVGEEKNNFRWGIGYDNDTKDGLFITRNFDPIYFSNKNTRLNIKKELYLQRLLKGNTESFSGKYKPVISEKVKQDLNAFDYLGIEVDLFTKLYGFDFQSNIDLNSLDIEKFKKIINAKSELSKLLYEEKGYNSTKNSKLSFFGAYREKIWNGSLGDIEILSAYGVKVNKRNNWIKNNITKSSSIAVGYGEYQSNKRFNTEEIINRKRLNIYLERNHTYPIWKPNIKDYYLKKDNKYSPNVIPYGLNLYAQSKLDLYRYDDGNYQNLLTLRGGPELTLGNFKNKFFDYSKLSIYPKATISEGKSPFSFDQSIDNHAIELSFKQQLIGALAIQYSTEYNLDINSSKYKEFYNSKYEISWNRRAYNLSLYYNSEQETGGLNFKIHSFNFDGIGNKF